MSLTQIRDMIKKGVDDRSDSSKGRDYGEARGKRQRSLQNHL